MGRVVGITVSGPRRLQFLSRQLPSTVWLLSSAGKGRIARYIGLGMQPVHLPDSLKSTLTLNSNGGLIVVNVEPMGLLIRLVLMCSCRWMARP